MKKLCFLIIICSFMITHLFASVTAPSLEGGRGDGSGGPGVPEVSAIPESPAAPASPAASSYETLWKTEQKMEEDGKPQSAYDVTQQILQKALREHHDGQALSARLRAVGLHQEWAPDSFFTDIAELEALRQAETRPVARAIYASILAEAYEGNRHRSQASGLEMTSADMKEWTVEQYDSATAANWRLSMTDIPALAQARSKDWLPFVAESTNSSYFKHDLLHVLWSRFRDRQQRVWSTAQQELLATGQAVREEYARQGNREAELLVALDIANRSGYDSSYWLKHQNEPFTPNPHLAALCKEFADLPLCTEVYLSLMNEAAPDSVKAEWAETCLRQYPDYERINAVRNALNSLTRPEIRWNGNATYYPGKSYAWPLQTKNVGTVHIDVVRLPDNFSEEAMMKSKLQPVSYLRSKGKVVQTLTHHTKSGKPYELVDDSVQWQAPDLGFYALLLTGTTTDAHAAQKQASHYRLFRVSRLMPIQRSWEKNRLDVVVVDAESGQPVQGATVQLFEHNYRTNKRTLVGTQTSDAEGRTRFNTTPSGHTQLITAVTKGDDRWLPEQESWGQSQADNDEREQTEVRLYTDRAIYRPGQQVHVGGVVFRQKHWDTHALPRHELELLMRDANGKEVGKQTVRTDEMGVFAADFALPEGGLPGHYQVRGARASVSFRVEEYKRPTFEVTMDETPALQWPQDCIRLTGKAVGYNGVPVRDGRVTATYQFTYPYWWWFRHDDSPRMDADTVATDETGHFELFIPLRDIPEKALTYGLRLVCDVQVLSLAGETREGRALVPICTQPLRLNITMNEQQDRDRLQKPSFRLLTSTDKEAAGTISWQIVPKGAAKDAMPLASGTFEQKVPASATATTSLTDALKALPSGQYELRAQAQAGADTASAHTDFMLFGMTDTQLAAPTDWWCYMPTNRFNAKEPARVQIGSSLDDVALYYTVTGRDGIIKDELIPLSNELRTLEIPYEEAYGDGVMLHFVFVKHGICHQENRELQLSLPDNELRWEWTTFRDHTHPGEQETWTLRLTHPDGTPASANVMATVFDASLNQLANHDWRLYIGRYHHIPYTSWQLRHSYNPGSASLLLDIPMKSHKVKPLAFDEFDARWLEGISFIDYRLMGRIAGLETRAKGVRMMKAGRANGAMVEEMAPMAAMATADMSIDTFNAVDQEVALSESEVMEDAGATTRQESASASAPIAALRTNFNETAAFLPRMHTDPATGLVTLAFTLPESLTTWQLLGIAHTPDMQSARIEAQTIASKELMASLHLPRFLRVADQGSIRATIQNLTDEALQGTALFEVFDPETERLILKQEAPFQTDARGETVMAFSYTPTDAYPIVAVRFTATTGTTTKASKGRKRGKGGQATATFADGEQRYLAILPSKEWVTESIEIQADSLGTFTTDLSTLFNKNHPSATQRLLTVEYTTHPIWNVVQALPALREPDTDDVLTLTAAFYANTLTTHIAATTPRLQTIIELWKEQAAMASSQATAPGTQARPAADGSSAGSLTLASPLACHEDLKQIILDETPWLREAETDAERRAQLIDLFNPSLVESRIGNTLRKLAERQESDGGFSWFPGMRSSELMTRLVAIELTHLRALTNNFAALTPEARQQTNTVLQRAFAFVAKENAEWVKEMKKAEAKGATINTGTLMHLHYVYIAQRAGVRLTGSQQADVRYLLDHLKGSVSGMSNEERAVAAIVLKADKREREARLYFDSMVEHLTTTPNHGTFFDHAGGSFTPTSHKVMVHTAALEAVRELAPANRALLGGMRRWLLQQKRTQMWESSICTTNAIYAMLNGAASELKNTTHDQLTLNYARKNVAVETDTKVAALGYIHATYTDGNAPRAITVRRNSPTEAWGAVYAQYLTPVADASAQASGLSVRRELSSTKPQVGDKLTTRYVITADRDYEYVCLRAERPAAAEPGSLVSGYRYQGGLGYYMAVRDARTDYFFDRLPKGTYVLEETTYIDRAGTYSSGLATIRCLYAPEYGGNSEDKRVEIREQR